MTDTLRERQTDARRRLQDNVERLDYLLNLRIRDDLQIGTLEGRLDLLNFSQSRLWHRCPHDWRLDEAAEPNSSLVLDVQTANILKDAVETFSEKCQISQCLDMLTSAEERQDRPSPIGLSRP